MRLQYFVIHHEKYSDIAKIDYKFLACKLNSEKSMNKIVLWAGTLQRVSDGES